jgi:hypothetical protein
MRRMNIQGVDRQSVEEASREAEAKPLAFAPGARANFIRDHVRDVQAAMGAGKSDADIKTQYADFNKGYPELMKKLLTKSDLSHLGVMLNALDKMEEGTLNQHQASIMVGQRLVDKIVKPQLNGSAPNRQGH